MRAFSQVFLTLPTVANIRGLESIAVALCCAIAICLSGIANAETETYAWSGTILSVDVDNGTGVYAGTQIGDTFSGTFTYDPDVANIDGLDTSDGDAVIEPGDVWVEYFLGSDSATLTDGMTELTATEVTLSITTDIPLDDPDDQEFVSDLFGREVPLGTLIDVWGLDFGDGLFEFEVAYASLVNMQDDLSFRPTPPWTPPGSPDDPDNQIAIFQIFEVDDPVTENEIFSAYGTIKIAQIQQFELASFADISGNGRPEVAALVQGGSSHVHIRDGSTDALISDINFGDDLAIDMAVLPDLNASGDPEIAILNQQLSGQVRVQIRDSITGNLVKNLWYGLQYEPVSMAVVPDYSGNAFPEIAVLGSEAGTDAIRVQVRDSASNTFLDNVFLGTQSTAKDLVFVTDTSGNGIPEMGILGVLKANKQVRMQVWDAQTSAFQTNVWFGKVYQPLKLMTMPDINGNGADEVVAVGVDPVTQNIRIQVRDSLSTAILKNIWLGNVNTAVDIKLINDINGNGFDDLAILLETPAGVGRVRVQDGSTGAFIRNLFFSVVENPVGLAVLPDYSGNGFDELAALGTSGGVRHVQILDTNTGAQVNRIDFP